MTGQEAFQGIPQFKGAILLCEDNEFQQYFMKTHLQRCGLDVTVAGNGKECVELAADRLSGGGKPFDLIFMDIYMPVMDGLEAADALASLGLQAPVVALSSNAMPSDRERYKAHGMPDFLSKPATLEELWACLLRYFTPLGFVTEKEEERAREEADKRHRLLTGFVRRHQTTFGDISAAIGSGDIKRAHRLAHTLKGLAGLMGETALGEASQAVEQSLADGGVDDIPGQLAALGRELEMVLAALSPLLDAQSPPPGKAALDKAEAAKVLERLEPLLQDDSARCLDLVGELREIPGTGDLIVRIEDYEFEKALEALATLKKSLEI